MKVFLDANVLLDVLLERDPHFTDSRNVWALAESRQIDASVCASSLPTVFYVARRTRGTDAAWAGVRLICDVFSLVPTDEQIIRQALSGKIADFEDAVQFYSALGAGAMVLVTRNQRDFPADKIDILTPSQFLDIPFQSSAGSKSPE